MCRCLSRLLQRSLFVAAIAGSAAGCAGLDFSKPIPWQDKTAKEKVEEEEEQFEEPQRIVSIWNEQTLHHSDGRPSSRGFGGRLMFYGKDKENSIQAKGDLVVYAYDETAAVMRGEVAAATSKPNCRYKFTAEKFKEHYRESTAGHAYDFWIPWDKVGGEKRIITLAPVFILPNGKSIPGEPKQCVLMGRTPQIQNVDVQRTDKAAIEYGVRPVGYEAPVSGALNSSVEPSRRAVETTTISIPTSMAMRGGSLPARNEHMASLPQDPNVQLSPSAAAYFEERVEKRQEARGEAKSTPRGEGQREPAANLPGAFHPPLRGRSGLGQPRVPAAPTAQPASSRSTWEQYRLGQQLRQRVEPERRSPPSVPATW